MMNGGGALQGTLAAWVKSRSVSMLFAKYSLAPLHWTITLCHALLACAWVPNNCRRQAHICCDLEFCISDWVCCGLARLQIDHTSRQRHSLQLHLINCCGHELAAVKSTCPHNGRYLTLLLFWPPNTSCWMCSNVWWCQMFDDVKCLMMSTTVSLWMCSSHWFCWVTTVHCMSHLLLLLGMCKLVISPDQCHQLPSNVTIW